MTEQDFSDRTAAWMKQLEEDPALRLRPLPDPDLLWMKARLLDRQRTIDRALSPLDRLDDGLRIVLISAVCWLALSLIADVVRPFTGPIPPIWISGVFSTAICIIAFAAYPVWTSE